MLETPDTVLSVAVFVEEMHDTPPISSSSTGARTGIAKDALLLRGDDPVAQVVDLPWEGEDETHFERAAAAQGRVMLAGGLSPENVQDAIRAVRPWAVDASSSLEVSPGVKDHDRVRAFVEMARC